jgi:hypothetical protein
MQHEASAQQDPHTCSGEEMQPSVPTAAFSNTADVQAPQSPPKSMQILSATDAHFTNNKGITTSPFLLQCTVSPP